jgi:hypothetical protein
MESIMKSWKMHSSEKIESGSASERDSCRIGLIAVHGIGDQGRCHFLDALVRDLQCGFKAARKDAVVSMVLHTPEASLVYLGQHARFAIRARMLRTMADAALRDYVG